MRKRGRRQPVGTMVSIDAVGTNICDDAIGLARIRRRKEVLVDYLIADVPAHVLPWRTADMKAMRRNDHLRGRSIFPRKIAEDWSLSATEERSAIRFRFSCNERMRRVHQIHCKLVRMRLTDALSFRDIPSLVNGNHPDRSFYASLLHTARNAAAGSSAGNFGRGRRKETFGSRIMAELSVFANTELTRYCVEHGVPIIYRNTTRARHIPRDIWEQYEEHRVIAEALGLPKRRFGGRFYSHLALGHRGLRLDAYAGFTSPLREWDTLANLRQIRAHMLGHELPYDELQMRLMADELNRVAWRREFRGAVLYSGEKMRI